MKNVKSEMIARVFAKCDIKIEKVESGYWITNGYAAYFLSNYEYECFRVFWSKYVNNPLIEADKESDRYLYNKVKISEMVQSKLQKDLVPVVFLGFTTKINNFVVDDADLYEYDGIVQGVQTKYFSAISSYGDCLEYKATIHDGTVLCFDGENVVAVIAPVRRISINGIDHLKKVFGQAKAMKEVE